MKRTSCRKIGRTAVALALGGLFAFSGPVNADVIDDDTEVWVPAAPVEVEEEVAVVECPECGRNNGAFSFNMGMDVATQYFFRGILQEDAGFIGQPYMNVGVSLYENEGGALSSIALNGGMWNSIHSRKTGANGNGPANWYEADAYGGISFGFMDQLEISTLYTAYLSPNGAFNTVQEIGFGIGWDDSDLLGMLALHPAAFFAIETDNTVFGSKKGQYVELTAGPEFPITEGDWAFTIGIPMRLGLSLDDYYECTGAPGSTPMQSANCPTTATSGTNQNTFGFFDVAVRGGLALPFLHTDYGDWELTSAVHFTSLGDSLQYQNNGDSWNFYGLFGIGMTY